MKAAAVPAAPAKNQAVGSPRGAAGLNSPKPTGPKLTGAKKVPLHALPGEMTRPIKQTADGIQIDHLKSQVYCANATKQAKEGVIRDTKHALFPERKSGDSDYRREQQKAELETSKKKESSLKIELQSYEEYTALESEEKKEYGKMVTQKILKMSTPEQLIKDGFLCCDMRGLDKGNQTVILNYINKQSEHITHLNLYGSDEIQNLSVLANCSNLQTLSVQGCPEVT